VRTDQVEGEQLGENDAAVKAIIRVLDVDHEYVLDPSFVIRDRAVGRKAQVSNELGLRIQFNEINPQTGEFTFAVNTKQRDFIVMKALEKPLINILWLGTFVLTFGFLIATVRRFRDFFKNQKRELAAEAVKPKKRAPQRA